LHLSDFVKTKRISARDLRGPALDVDTSSSQGQKQQVNKVPILGDLSGGDSVGGQLPFHMHLFHLSIFC
jgi:hypothetical protein